MALEALLFDVDGTIANTEDEHRHAFNRTFEAHGLSWYWDAPLYRELLKTGGGKERMLHYVRTCRPEEALQPGLTELIAELHREKTGYYNEAVMKGQISLRPGFERLLREARQARLRLAITTTTSLVNVESLFKATLGQEVLGWFEVIGSGERAKLKKPWPDIYLWVLAQMRLDPKRCLAVEDSSIGVKAALGAGIPVVVTENPYTEGDDFSGALAVMDQLGDEAHPFAVKMGHSHGKNFADLELLRKWMGE